MNPIHAPWNLVEQTLLEDGTKVAIHDAGRAHTYADLHRDVVALSSGLAARYAPGSRVAFLIGNRYEYLLADLAVWRSALIKVPLNPMLSAREVSHIVEHSGAQAMLISRRLVIVTDELLTSLAEAGIDVIDVDASGFHELLTTADTGRRETDAADPAVILYTGGTTGLPKGVVHSHLSVAHNLLAHIQEGDVRRDDVMLLSTALSHSAGVFAQAGLVKGATIALREKFDPAVFCDASDDLGVTWTTAVPTMLYRLIDYVTESGRDVPRLHTFVYGSAPIAPSRLAQAIEMFGPIFIQLFGQTEVPNWATTLTKEDHARALAGGDYLRSAGRRSTMAAVRIVDDEGRDLSRGEIGEVIAAAPYVMTEYWDNPQATAEKLVDGWVHTKDIGYLDDEGYLYLKDRKSDMIISGGYNVYSSEVEAVIAALPGVTNAAVIGIPHADWGEQVCAVVVHTDPSDETAQRIRTASREALGAYKAPKQIVFATELPLTPFGKIDKKKLRAPHWANESRAI